MHIILANVNLRSRSLYAVARPPVCRLSVTLVHFFSAKVVFITINLLIYSNGIARRSIGLTYTASRYSKIKTDWRCRFVLFQRDERCRQSSYPTMCYSLEARMTKNESRMCNKEDAITIGGSACRIAGWACTFGDVSETVTYWQRMAL